MSSALVGPEAAARMVAALTDVAERSFFSAAEPCDRERFAALAAGEEAWLAATVGFDEADCAGTVTCRLPDALAMALFDAFNGRDPGDSPPPEDELFDLVGEFGNMTCGAWLTRTADQAFALGGPAVTRGGRFTAADEGGRGAREIVLLTVNDLPLAIEIQIGRTVPAQDRPARKV